MTLSTTIRTATTELIITVDYNSETGEAEHFKQLRNP